MVPDRFLKPLQFGHHINLPAARFCVTHSNDRRTFFFFPVVTRVPIRDHPMAKLSVRGKMMCVFDSYLRIRSVIHARTWERHDTKTLSGRVDVCVNVCVWMWMDVWMRGCVWMCLCMF